MGFNEDASIEAKKSFIKYLMRESNQHDQVANMYKYKIEVKEKEEVLTKEGEQLSLFDQTGTG